MQAAYICLIDKSCACDRGTHIAVYIRGFYAAEACGNIAKHKHEVSDYLAGLQAERGGIGLNGAVLRRGQVIRQRAVVLVVIGAVYNLVGQPRIVCAGHDLIQRHRLIR